MIIDTHTHILDGRFDNERSAIVAALGTGVLSGVIEVGYDLQTSKAAVELAEKNKRVYCAIGIHPHDAESANNEQFDWIEKNAGHKKVVAVGEVGLDYFRDLSPRDVQKAVFVRQLQIANDAKLPVIIHLRDAYEDMYNLLLQNKGMLQNGVLLHCYSGSAEMVEMFSKFDCYFALGGVITFKNAKKDDVINAIPRDRLVLETDCPYCTPTPYRGQTNQPQYVVYVAEKVASVLGLTPCEVENICTQNTLRLFNKMDKSIF